MSVYNRMISAMGAFGDGQTSSGKAGGSTSTPTGAHTASSTAAIQDLQRAIMAYQSCSLEPYGADGRWGPVTRAGVQCLAQQIGGLDAVYTMFPFARQLMSQSTSSGGGGGRTGGGSSGGQQQSTTTNVQTASILDMSSPWLWVIVAGVLAAGGVAVWYFNKGDDDLGKLSDDELKRRIFEKQIEAGVGTIPQTQKQ